MSMVYILKAKNTNFFKIGRTDQSVERRVKQLQTGCPIPIEIYKTIETSSPINVERAFHDYLMGCETVGEWFDVDEGILENMMYVSLGALENYIPE